MDVYPIQLPPPIREGYEFAPVSSMVRTEMQSGRARQRRRFTSVPTMASVSWILTAVQARYFESWYEGVLTSGSEWFEMPLITPLGNFRHVVRFTDIYRGPTPITVNHFKYTAQLEMRDRPIVDPSWAIYAAQYILQSDIFDQAMNREWPAA